MSPNDDLYITLDLAIRLEHTCLHDGDLYIPLASAICLVGMCLHDDGLYTPLALLIHLTACISMMICIYPWPRQYVLTVCLHDDDDDDLYIPLALAMS